MMDLTELTENMNNAIECVATLYEQLDAFFDELKREMKWGDPPYSVFSLPIRSPRKINRGGLIAYDGRLFLPADLESDEDDEEEVELDDEELRAYISASFCLCL